MFSRIFLSFLLVGICYLPKAQQPVTDVYKHRIDSMIAADSLAEVEKTIGTLPAKATREAVVKYAKEFMGLRYRRGGGSNKGFDCSGFTSYIFAHFGVKLPHTSSGQSLYGIDVPAAKLMKGDLIFFKGANMRRRTIGHVGIVISEKGEPVRFIHSSTSEGIRIDYLSSYYYRLRFVKGKRILFE
jgi:cell wall-associated NlpC family hydrolase